MITIVIGTNRLESMTARVGGEYARILHEHDIPHQILRLEDLPRDFAFADMYGARTEKMQRVIEKYVSPVAHFVFIIPEYNGGFPGVLKTFIDAVPPKDWHGKWAALVGLSSGQAGNLRGLDQFGNILNYLQVNVLFRKPKLSGVEGLFKDGRLAVPSSDKLRTQATELVEVMR